MSSNSKMVIEVDAQAAEILKRAARDAEARGESLGSYLRARLASAKSEARTSSPAQSNAWTAFVAGMSQWSASNLPAGYVADDSRSSIYGDRG